jgi:hypothetical protein
MKPVISIVIPMSSDASEIVSTATVADYHQGMSSGIILSNCILVLPGSIASPDILILQLTPSIRKEGNLAQGSRCGIIASFRTHLS